MQGQLQNFGNCNSEICTKHKDKHGCLDRSPNAKWEELVIFTWTKIWAIISTHTGKWQFDIKFPFVKHHTLTWPNDGRSSCTCVYEKEQEIG